MKSFVRVFLLALLVTGIASCSLLDVERDVEFAANLNIEVEEPVLKSTDGIAFIAIEFINPEDNEVVEEYGELVENYDVSEIVAVVTSVSQTDDLDVVFLSGSAFSIYQGGKTATWTMDSDWPVEVGTTFGMGDLGDAYGLVSDILLSHEQFSVSAFGETNVGGVYVTLKVTIKSKLTANPLN